MGADQFNREIQTLRGHPLSLSDTSGRIDKNLGLSAFSGRPMR